ncbi:MAG: alkaline phosphatase [Bacteroidetes bacterium]|nr:alkaline phosphatase [Bacteroidota bacterium]
MKSIGFSFLILTIILSSCKVKQNTVAVPTATQADQTPSAKKVIFLIGDGMGLTQISLLHQQDNTSAFSRFKCIGLINTSSASHKITDSAAGATAFACGSKTYNGAIGMGQDSTPLETLAEFYHLSGKSTGVVSTSSVTHATPASFYAHAKNRSLESEIAQQLIESDLNFFAGGGRIHFKDHWANPGVQNWIIDTSDFLSIPFEFDYHKKHGFLLADDGMPRISEGRGTFLTDASRLAIEILDQDTNGFFLMIEGSQIDWGGHANDAAYVEEEMKDFDQVLNMVLDYARKDGNTLVVVTADHETGGLALTPKEVIKDSKTTSDYNIPVPKFNTGGHTSTLIPVFAFGPGADAFMGIYQNNDIYYKIRENVK